MVCDVETYCDRLVRTVTGNMSNADIELHGIINRGGLYKTRYEQYLCRSEESKRVRDMIPADKYSRL